MKPQHITLPAIQVAAVAFFAASAEAKVYCTDTAGKVVAQASCDGTQPANTFFLADHEGEDLQLGDVIAEDKVDASHSVARDLESLEAEAEAGAEHVSGGFGRRACNPSLGHCVVSGVGKGGGGGGGSSGSGSFGG